MMRFVDRFMIRGHLARASMRLAKRDTSHLSELQRTRRHWARRELRRYWFSCPLPRNTYGVQRTPVFQDRSGRRCAVAHLVSASGNEAIVARIQHHQNLGRVHDIIDPEFSGWATNHGLTIDELADIQPSYSNGLYVSLTLWVGVIGALGLVSCAISIAGLFKGTRLWCSFARVASLLAVVSSVAATTVVLVSNTSGCMSPCTIYELPAFALPLLAALWGVTAMIGGMWFQRWHTLRTARHRVHP
ncbi:MAG: hypothetical protein ABIS18_09405 [Actinomycetota bacterium]